MVSSPFLEIATNSNRSDEASARGAAGTESFGVVALWSWPSCAATVNGMRPSSNAAATRRQVFWKHMIILAFAKPPAEKASNNSRASARAFKRGFLGVLRARRDQYPRAHRRWARRPRSIFQLPEALVPELGS